MSKFNVNLTPLDELFTNEEGREDAKREKVMDIPLEELYPFKGHPFQVVENDELTYTHSTWYQSAC
ncbi:MAG: hypothetical protein A2Y15_09005 [Clostridiales bacterium GWF2_36_10]|nr:MAG: hypothetical protein A2Y15_09005 [Clostridiales bacterium GWF2_36_10]